MSFYCSFELKKLDLLMQFYQLIKQHLTETIVNYSTIKKFYQVMLMVIFYFCICEFGITHNSLALFHTRLQALLQHHC